MTFEEFLNNETQQGVTNFFGMVGRTITTIMILAILFRLIRDRRRPQEYRIVAVGK